MCANSAQLAMPSGRIVNYTYNGAARPITAIDANGTQYVSNVTHWPSGAEYQRWMPNIYFNTTLNNRLQISGLYSDNGQTASYYMNKTYSYGPQNNGNVASIVNNKDPNRTATYTYDALNRITAGWSSANTGGYSWGENYTIDGWGNLMISPMGGKAHGGNFQCAGDNSNRATCLSYDASGNVTANGSTAYSYDQENRLSSTAATNYLYDADGNRVKKSSGSTGTLYWYALPGIIAETDLTGTLKSEYVFFNGKRVARIDSPGSSLHYYLSDHLNSTTMVVSSSGTPEEESDYSPFGSEYQVTGTGANHYKFTGKERDNETGLDYFGARYYGFNMGRFTSPDKPFADQHVYDPQSWNLYTYTRNNPLKYIDTDGHKVQVADQGALNNIRQGLPANVRSHVVTDKNGFISGKALNGVKSNDANFQALKHMVGAKATVEVSTGPSATNAAGKTVEFKYESDAAVRKDLQNMGITPTPGKDYTTNGTGITYGANESKSGNIEVHVSDGTGQAATAPGVELVVTTGHELYVHGANLLDGKPAEHENSPNGPVNQQTREVEERTRKNAEDPK